LADKQPTSLFQLPEGKTIETFAVRLADGRVVMRTREEIEAMPPELRGALTPPKASK